MSEETKTSAGTMANPKSEDIRYKEPVWIGGRKRPPQIPQAIQAKLRLALSEAKAASEATGEDILPEKFGVNFMTLSKKGNEVRIHKASDAPNRAQRRAQTKLMSKVEKGPNFQKAKPKCRKSKR